LVGNGGRSTVDRTSSGPSPMDQVHRLFNSRINPKIVYFGNIAKRPLGFSEISPQYTKFQEVPLFTKIVPDIAPAHRITPSSVLCIHITLVCCILLIDCLCLLHVRKRWSHSSRILKTMLLRNPYFSSWSSKASVLDHFVPIIFSSIL
jgi:hypothetical protein